MTGELVRMVSNKGFAFIKGKENGIDYFFHHDDFNGHWKDLVQDFEYADGVIQLEFTPNESPKGPRASDVKRLDYPNQIG